MNKKFPKELFVKWEESGGNEEPYLLANEDVESASEHNETVRVGVYRLFAVKRVVNGTRVE